MNHECIFAPVTPRNARNSEAAAVEIEEDRLLLAWSDFYGGPTDFSGAHISSVVSEDNGRTWGDKFTLVENQSIVNTMMPSLLRLDSGELALFYLKLEDVSDSRLFICKSFDEGKTWNEEICITPDPGFHSPANDRCIQLSNGRIVVPDSVQDMCLPDGKSATLRSYFSDDKGKTWQQGRGKAFVPGGGEEPVIVERKNGSLLMYVRTRLSHIYSCESSDAGDSWSVPAPTSLVSATSPSNMKRIPSTGDLLIIWNNSLDMRKRNPLTVAISVDDGTTWKNSRNVEDDEKHSFGYPSITFLGDDVMLTYYRSYYQFTGWELKIKILPVSWFYE